MDKKITEYWRQLLINCHPENEEWIDGISKINDQQINEIGETVKNFVLNFDFRLLGEALVNLGITMKNT